MSMGPSLTMEQLEAAEKITVAYRAVAELAMETHGPARGLWALARSVMFDALNCTHAYGGDPVATRVMDEILERHLAEDTNPKGAK